MYTCSVKTLTRHFVTLLIFCVPVKKIPRIEGPFLGLRFFVIHVQFGIVPVGNKLAVSWMVVQSECLSLFSDCIQALAVFIFPTFYATVHI